MLTRLKVAVVVVGVLGSPSWAQEPSPAIIPESLQQLSIELGIPDRLGIEWAGVTSEDIGRYMGILAGVNEIAIEIATRSGREEPSTVDYQAAFAAACMWPNNKPPTIQKYWPVLVGAFADQSVRDELRAAVGPAAVQLVDTISEDQTLVSDDPTAFFPESEASYFQEFLDIGRVK
jgi:hypothetical protein